jgi:hypothetical protein
MTSRTIILSDEMIHSRIDEKNRLIFFAHLDNAGTEIPFDWHEGHVGSMEIEIHFTFSRIIDELIDWHSFSTEEEEGIWFHSSEKKLVELCKKDLQKCLDMINEVKFLEEES